MSAEVSVQTGESRTRKALGPEAHALGVVALDRLAQPHFVSDEGGWHYNSGLYTAIAWPSMGVIRTIPGAPIPRSPQEALEWLGYTRPHPQAEESKSQGSVAYRWQVTATKIPTELQVSDLAAQPEQVQPADAIPTPPMDAYREDAASATVPVAYEL